ncbi:hypothetical protein, partial [Escherichia coli]|uniref:hypothetical protein n=1 Tax=Escherichia coli TaxID=562 RepID=UPI001BDB9FA8
FCRSDKAFTPHPASMSDATVAASYQAYARQRNSLIWRDFVGRIRRLRRIRHQCLMRRLLRLP